MSESLENLVTVCENLETLKHQIIFLIGETSTDEGVEGGKRALLAAEEATRFALQAMRNILTGD